MLDEQNFDPDAMIRKARVKARGMKQQVSVGRWGNIISESYNVMYMAARGALTKMGFQANTHQTVAARYRREIIEKKLIDAKFADHLSKIKTYWENEQNGQPEQIDQARAERIVKATIELVDALATIGDPSKRNIDPRMLHYNQ